MKALWLEPGRAPVNMTLDNDRVPVREGTLHGHYHWYTDGAQGEQHLMLTFCEEKAIEMKFDNQIPFRMKRVGGNVYRNHNRSQILVFQDMNKDVAEPGTNEPECGDEDGFQCLNSFVYCHPGQQDANLRIGVTNDGQCKMSWQGGPPTGSWNIKHLQAGTELPSSIDATQPVLTATFHCEGNESQERGTVYALLKGTEYVYRAIGCEDKGAGVRLYTDSELEFLQPWHIVLVARSWTVFVY